MDIFCISFGFLNSSNEETIKHLNILQTPKNVQHERISHNPQNKPVRMNMHVFYFRQYFYTIKNV